MKKFRLLILCTSVCSAAVFTGCVDTANNELSEVEQDWVNAIRDSYPGYRTPKTMPPAVRGSVVYYDESKPAAKTEQPAPAVSDDPAAAVDKAASANDELPVAKEEKLPAAEKVQSVKPEQKTVDAAAEKPAVKEEKPAAKEEKPAAKEEKPAAKEEKPAAKEEKSADDKKTAGAAAKNGNAEITVKSGDTIGAVAKEFYGNAKYADVILKANPHVKDPKRLKIGTKLIIPAL